MYGLNRCRSYQMLTTEEGLATLNTHLSLSCRYLWWPALLYCECENFPDHHCSIILW